MSNNLGKMIKTCKEFIALAKEMLQSCQLKANKVHSDSRKIASFFFKRSWEMFESILILIEKNRIVDSAILLRSLCNISILAEYVLKDQKLKEIRSNSYILEAEKERKKLLNKNVSELKKFRPDIDKRIAKLKSNVSNLKADWTNKHGNKSWDLPSISKMAKETGPRVQKYYNQVYSYYSSVEHHNLFFGESYIDMDTCEPIETPEEIEKSVLFRPEMILFLSRGLFLEILKHFNSEFKLNWGTILSKKWEKHWNEYQFLGEKPRSSQYD